MIKLLLTLLIFFLIFTEGMAHASTFAYSGRLVKTDGTPVTGEPDLRFDLSYSNTPSTIEDTYTIYDVPLVDGVFTVELDFSNFDSVYAGLDSTKSLLITVTNVEVPSSPIVYDAQTIRPVPMAGVAGIASKLSLSCAQDEVVAFDASGNLACASNGQGSVVSVTAGSGVLVDNTDPANPVVSADWTAIGSCGPGAAIQAINADGSVVCEVDDNTTLSAGNGTVINAGALDVDPAPGSGLIFKATQLDTDRALLQTRVVQACDPGQAIGVIHQNGNVTCEDVTPNLDGQTTACSDDQILKANGGNFVCANAGEAGKWKANGNDIYYETGKVGIGLTSPATSLDVSNSSYYQQRLGNSSSQELWLGAIADTVGSFIGANARYDTSYKFNPNYSSASGINFRQNGSTEFWNDTGLTPGVSYTPTKTMVIGSAGNVGIGVLSPSAKLEVNGNIKVSSTSDVCIDGGPCLSAAAGGDITDVFAGTGLTGGASSGPATLNVDVGTTAGKIVQLDALAKLPAVDGSQLTNLPNPTTSTTLSTFVTGPDSTITNTDTVETAFEKTQGQINANKNAIATKVENTVTVNGKPLSSNVDLDTDEVAEGTSNKYFTDTRAKTAAVVNSTAGNETDQAASVDAMKTYVLARTGAINESQWTTSGSDIYYSGGNVGVGTAAPSERLEVSGNLKVGSATFDSQTILGAGQNDLTITSSDMLRLNPGYGRVKVSTGISTETSGVQIPADQKFSFGGVEDYLRRNSANGHSVELSGWGNIVFRPGNGEKVRFTSSGNVGIGTSTPSEKLEVNGSIKVSSTSDVCIDGGGCLSAAAGGDITDVFAGTGLEGGATSGPATLNVDVGTTAGKIVQLDENAKLPALDGSQLTNLPNPTTSTTLTGFVAGSDSSITNTDTVETAFEKAQGQIDGNKVAIASNAGDIASNTTALANKADKTTTVNGKALSSNIDLTTDDVSEGSANLYSQWKTNGPSLFYNTGNIGLGVSTPVTKLDVNGAIKEKNYVTVYVDPTAADNTGSGMTSTDPKQTLCAAINAANSLVNRFVQIQFQNTSDTQRAALGGNCAVYNKVLAFKTPSAGAGKTSYIDWNGTVTPRETSFFMSWNSENRVDIKVTSSIMFNSGGGRVYLDIANGSVTFTVNDSYFLYSRYVRSNNVADLLVSQGGNINVASGVTGVLLHKRLYTGNPLKVSMGGNGSISPAINTSANVFFENKIYANKNGNVGIGTSTPTAKLEVKGSIKVSSASDVCIDGGACLSAAQGGDITEVVAGNGLTGGADSGSASLNVNTGTGANQIVQLDAGAKLPPVDGSLLTNLPNPTTSTALSGFEIGADAAITNTDTVETAFEKTQGQINANKTSLAGKVNNTTTVNGKPLSSNVDLTTDDVSEGAANQYFTAARAQTATVVDSTAGAETAKAPSVNAVKNYVTTQINSVNQSQWTTTGSDIYYNAGFVGIGTSAPNQKLHVTQDQTTQADNTPLVYFSTTGTATDNKGNILWLHSTRNEGSDTADLFKISNAIGTKLTVRNTGNVGIGTASPVKLLDVNGSAKIGSPLVSSGESTAQGLSPSAGKGFLETPWVYTNNIESADEKAGASTGIALGTSSTPTGEVIGHDEVAVYTNGATKMMVKASGNVGIGTTTPTAKLDVNGTVKANNFSGTLNGLKMAAGQFSFVDGACGDTVGAACSINIASGGFSTAPVCTITMRNSDATSYTEKMVIKTTTTTNLYVWRGNYQDAGTTMKGNWICIGS